MTKNIKCLRSVNLQQKPYLKIQSDFFAFNLYFCLMKIDLRSDTFTQPTAAMLEFMMQAPTGDDVFGEDPTVNELETMTAKMFGKEAGLFCPSGTMTNQIAIKCHTQPGQEVICEQLSHVYSYEGGGIAFNSGCQVKTIKGERGLLKPDQIVSSINPDDIHKPPTALVVVENTSNRGGGSCYDMSDLQEIRKICTQYQLGLHLDGARIWNAMIAKNQQPASFGQLFDSLSICLSKGLGAPVGSVLLGDVDFIKKARRIRKLLGGGMRQAGYLAAAGIYAIHHHIDRLRDDHLHAKQIASALQQQSWVDNILPVETNMVIFDVKPHYKAQEIATKLKEKDIHCIAISEQSIRMVTHLNVTANMIDIVIDTINNIN